MAITRVGNLGQVFRDGQSELACFRLLLGREPHPEEWPGHSQLVGCELRGVVASYLNSVEFANRGLVSGLISEDKKEYEMVRLPEFSMWLSRQDTQVGSPIAAFGEYEPHVTREIRARLLHGSTFLDVGANIGYFSLLAASIVGPEGKVFAIEPNPANTRLLYASCGLNNFTNIAIVQAAADRTWGLLWLRALYSNGTVEPLPAKLNKLLSQPTVMALPIDTATDGQRVDLIKIDVEGYEFRALSGALRTIERWHPAIVSEFTPGVLPERSGIQPEEYLRFLAKIQPQS
jgi:FkbM family methyltransferase